MIGPEARQGISAFSAVSTPTKEGVDAPVLPKPDVKPVPASPPPEKPKKPSWARTKAGRIGLSVLALGGLGGAYEAYQYNLIPNIPSLSRSAEKPAETVAPFDNAKTEPQTITARVNATPLINVTQEQITSLFEDSVVIKSQEMYPDAGTNTLSILLPAKLGENDTIKTSPGLRDSEIIDDNGIHHAYKESLGRDFYYDKDAEIPLFVISGEIFQLPPKTIDGKPYFMGLVIRQTMADGNIMVIFVTAVDDVRDIVPAESLKDTPVVTRSKDTATSNIPYLLDAKNGIPLSITVDTNGKINTPTILKTTRDGAHVKIVAKSTKSDNISIDLITQKNQLESLSQVPFAPR